MTRGDATKPAMSAFEEMFCYALDAAMCQNRMPVMALFGPEEYADFRRAAQFMLGQSTMALMKGGPFMMDGLPVGRMKVPGVAVVTKGW